VVTIELGGDAGHLDPAVAAKVISRLGLGTVTQDAAGSQP
jgi:hypothetical protein